MFLFQVTKQAKSIYKIEEFKKNVEDEVKKYFPDAKGITWNYPPSGKGLKDKEDHTTPEGGYGIHYNYVTGTFSFKTAETNILKLVDARDPINDRIKANSDWSVDYQDSGKPGNDGYLPVTFIFHVPVSWVPSVQSDETGISGEAKKSPSVKVKTRQGKSGGESDTDFLQKVAKSPYWLLDWKKIATFEIDHKGEQEAGLFIEALLESKLGYYKDGNIIIRIEWDGGEDGLAEKFKAKLFQNGLVDDPKHANEIMSNYTRMLKEDGFKILEFSKVPKEIH